jgi:hypothetical protein
VDFSVRILVKNDNYIETTRKWVLMEYDSDDKRSKQMSNFPSHSATENEAKLGV